MEQKTVTEFPPTVDELLETFADLPEWDERYDFIIDLGRELPDPTAELAIVRKTLSMGA